MFWRILLFTAICGLVKSSGVGLNHLAPVAPIVPGSLTHNPVVTAASSQYFQRTFNRLVVPPVVAPVAPFVPPLVAPVAPVAPPPLAPVVPVAPAPTVFVQPTNSIPVAINPNPPQELPVQPNIAIAVATAHAAAPVATILLPPYPFGFPPTLGLIPSEKPTNIPNENTKEPTTQRTTEADTTTSPEPESTTLIDTSSSDNSFVQALPSNENVNFNLYGTPTERPRTQFQPQPQQPGLQFQPQLPNPQFRPQQPNGQFRPQQPNGQFRPQQPNLQPQLQPTQFQAQQPQFQAQLPQLWPQQSQFQPQEPQFPPYPPKRQPVPQLPPSRPQFQSRPQQPRPQQTWPHQKPQKFKTSVEVVPVPLAYITPPPLHKTHSHLKVVKHIYSYVPTPSAKIILKPVKIRPARLVKHKTMGAHLQNLRANARDIEVTTFNPFKRPNTKPPRV